MNKKLLNLLLTIDNDLNSSISAIQKHYNITKLEDYGTLPKEIMVVLVRLLEAKKTVLKDIAEVSKKYSKLQVVK